MQKMTLKKRKTDKAAKIFYISMIALPVLQFIIFYIVVNFNSILLAFQNYNSGTGKFEFAGLEWFETFFYRLFSTKELGISLYNSLIYCGLSVIIVMPLTMLFAYYIYKKMPLGGFFKIMLFAPSIITSMIWVLIYNYFMEDAIPDLCSKFGVEIGGLISNHTFLSLIIFHLLFSFGSCILLYLNAMQQIPKSTLEAAQIDGASEVRSFFSVVIPSIWPTIVSFFVINISQIGAYQANLYSFFQHSVPDMQLQTIGYIQFVLVAANPADQSGFPYASAIGLLLTLVIAPLTAIIRYLMNKYGPREE